MALGVRLIAYRTNGTCKASVVAETTSRVTGCKVRGPSKYNYRFHNNENCSRAHGGVAD